MPHHPTSICVRFMPAFYGLDDLPIGTSFHEAKRQLQPYLRRGLRCCVLCKGYAVYLELDGSETIGPHPYGGVIAPLGDELRG